jgi:hypothetical protein
VSDDTVVIFNFTFWAVRKDHSCVVKPQEYLELKHDSVIAYIYGALLGRPQVTALEQYGIREYVSSVPLPVLEKIKRGAVYRSTPLKTYDGFFSRPRRRRCATPSLRRSSPTPVSAVAQVLRSNALKFCVATLGTHPGRRYSVRLRILRHGFPQLEPGK